MKTLGIALAMLAAPAAMALEFTGNSLPAIETAPDSGSGLEGVYVLRNTAGVTVSYRYSGTAPIWYRFSNLGGAFAEPVASSADGSNSSIVLGSGDMGYIVEHDGRQHCYWIVDYAGHELELQAATVSAEQDCARLRLDITGNADEIAYYSINGRRIVLSRDIKIEYTSLAFDETSYTYTTTAAVEIVPDISGSVMVPAPVTATDYTISGDIFTTQWGEPQSVHTTTVQPYAVDAQTRATQAQRDNDNEQTEQTEGLGGSAPCDIDFEAAITDAAIFHEWQISRSPEFDINELTYTDLTFTFSFREQGTTYVRFVAANADATCEYVSPTYEVFIGESKLEIPNVFSPQNQDGVNDLWKVSYKSIVSFSCSIFNRWGHELFTTNDPATGWDGKHAGKFVPAGVYYYVIRAEGADGVSYNKAGDINIVGYSQGTPGTGSGTDTETTE